jgi:DNA-binding NarL/FixJ family response regulator
MPHRLKVFLVADKPVIRDGLALQIGRQRDLVLCGQAADACEARQRISASGPDVVIVDPMLRSGNGPDLLRHLKADHPRLPVLIFSSQEERVYAERALRAGARGYLMQQEPSESLATAIRRVHGGHVYLSESMRSHLLDHFCSPNGGDGSGLAQLTDRELEVFGFLGEGLRTRQIAARLHLSVKTVETYYERIKLRLHFESFHELVRQSALWVDAPQDGSSAAERTPSGRARVGAARKAAARPRPRNVKKRPNRAASGPADL